VLLFIAVPQICQRRSQLEVILAGALIGLLAASLQGVVQHYSGNFGGGFEAGGVGGTLVGRVQGSFDHPNQFAGFIAFLMPLAAMVMVTRGFSAPMRWLGFAGLAFAVPALIFTYARGSIAAAVLGAIVWLAFLRPRAAIAIAVVVAIAAVFLAPGALRERFDPQASHADLTERIDLWQGAIEMYDEHPFLGVGVNNYAVAYPNLPKTPAVAPEHRLLLNEEVQIPPHAHNLYLNTLAEGGILGAASLLLVIVMAISAAYRGCRLSDPIGRATCIGIGIGLMTLLANSMVEVTLLTEAALPLMALLGAATVFIGLESAPTPVSPREEARRSRMAVA
jgi:O-antigen ligase